LGKGRLEDVDVEAALSQGVDGIVKSLYIPPTTERSATFFESESHREIPVPRQRRQAHPGRGGVRACRCDDIVDPMHEPSTTRPIHLQADSGRQWTGPSGRGMRVAPALHALLAEARTPKGSGPFVFSCRIDCGPPMRSVGRTALRGERSLTICCGMPPVLAGRNPATMRK